MATQEVDNSVVNTPNVTNAITAGVRAGVVDTDIDNWRDWEEFEDYVEDIKAEGYSIDYDEKDGNRAFAALTKNMTGIFGLPYQWSTTVDLPLRETNEDNEDEEDAKYSKVGRKFSEKILSTMPVLFLTPGLAKFMALGSSEDKEELGNRLMSVLTGGEGSGHAREGTENRYYSFEASFESYRLYANVACKMALFYLGLKDVNIPIPGTKDYVVGGDFDIEKFLNNDFTKLFGAQTTLPFYVDAETSISEDFSNSTTESILATTANGFSQAARELQFIMGDPEGAKGLTKAIQNTTSAIGNLGELIGNNEIAESLVGKNMLTNIASELTTIVKGGKIIFPEIWADSSYSKSYNVTLKFRSPDPDPVSIFLNIYMPILLLITMAAPRQLDNSASSFESPFMVRANYKSIFTVDLGIIESLSITRGGDDKWNVMGMPVTADVSLSIKDLYGSMFVSNGMGIVNNTIQMDYIATLAGVDLNEFEITRIYQISMMIIGSSIKSIPSRFFGAIKQGSNRAGAGLLRHFGIDSRALVGR